MSDRSLDEFPGNDKSGSQSSDTDMADIGPGKVKDDVEGERVSDDVATPVAFEAKGGNDADQLVAVSGGDTTTAPTQNKETEPDVESTHQDVSHPPETTVESTHQDGSHPPETTVESTHQDGSHPPETTVKSTHQEDVSHPPESTVEEGIDVVTDISIKGDSQRVDSTVEEIVAEDDQVSTDADPEGSGAHEPANTDSLNQTTALEEGNVEAKLSYESDKTEDRSIGEEDTVTGRTNTGQMVSVLAAWSQLDQAEDVDVEAAAQSQLDQAEDVDVEAAEITQRDTKVDSQLQTAPSDDDTLALDVLPNTDDIEVAKYHDRLKETLKLQQYTQTLMVVARYLYIATLALATDAQYLTKAQELLFTSLKLCDKTTLMLQSFQSGANNILEKLKVAYLYCMDGFEDFARTDIEATKKDVKTMRLSAQETKRLLSDFRSQITEVQKSVGDESVKLKRAGVVAPKRGKAGGSRSLPGGSGPTGATASTGTDVDSDESFREEDDRFRSCKGDKELIEERERRKPSKPADVERSCTQSGQILPKYYPWTVLGLATLTLIAVVLHIVEHYDSIWPDKDAVYLPSMLIATISCLGLLYLFLGIFTACRTQFRLGIYLNLIVIISIALVFLQILDLRFLWWSRSYNNWISFPVAVLLLIIDAVCVKLLCQCGGPDERTNHGAGEKRYGQEPDSEDDNPSKGDTDFDDIERKSMWLRYGRFKLTEAVLLEAASNLDVASGLLDGLVPVVEGWFKECVDVLEPATEHGISETASMSSAEEKKGYWNSVVFKKEVTDYYCRWRALQVYSENTRPKLKTARQRIEQCYTENQYPRDAVVSAWKMAAEETVPEILHLVAQFSVNPTTCSVVHE